MDVMEKFKKHLNRFLTVLMIVCAGVCIVLSVQILQKGDVCIAGIRVYHILTGIMEPTIPRDGIILTKETDFGKLDVGDIITFSSRDPALNGAANTHRILAFETDSSGRGCIVTKGDNNPIPDDSRVYPEDIKGKVVYYSHMNGFSTFLSFIRTGPGFLTVIVLPLMFVAWCILKEFRKEIKATIRAQVEAEMAQEAAAVPAAPAEPAEAPAASAETEAAPPETEAASEEEQPAPEAEAPAAETASDEQ